jgi:hypothetical protein
MPLPESCEHIPAVIRNSSHILNYGTQAATLQNVPAGRSVLCEQENNFLKLMVQW